jgi:outer membrane autotransporter protein
MWFSGGYKNAKVDADGSDASKAEFDTDTVVVGADYRVNPNFTIGALFHYSNTDKAKLDDQGSRADVESRGFGVYAGYRQGGAYGNALAVRSSNDYKSTRTIQVPGYNYLASAKTSGHQTGLNIDGGYDFRISDQLVVGPLAGLQWVRLDVDGFEEKGALAASLAVDDQTMTSLLGRVGGRLNWNTTVCGNDTFSLDVHAAFQHEFKADSHITATFIGSGLDAFTVKTTDSKRNSILLGTGFNFDFHGVASIFANYDMQTGSSNWHEQNVRGGVKISF